MLFLIDSAVPSPAQMMAHLHAAGLRVDHHPDHPPPEKDTWVTLGLSLSPAHPPVIVEAEQRHGPEGRLMQQEVNLAAGRVRAQPSSQGRSEALRRLQSAQVLVGVQIARDDDAGWHIAEALVTFLEKQPGTLLAVGGGEFFLDGVPIKNWQPSGDDSE
jgi:hypothetical protein